MDANLAPVNGEGGESPLKILWRHKFIVLVLAICGIGFGHWSGQQKPTTYSAATQLMIKSDRPLVIDSATGSVVSGLPSGEILGALVSSDQIVQVAAADAEMSALASMQGRTPSSIAGTIRSGIRFVPQTKENTSRDRMIAVLSYDGKDPDLCVASVNATSRAIQAFFNSERDSSANRLADMIEQAEKKLLPQLTQLEADYQDFRRDSALQWDAEGRVINPHRERQAALQTQYVQTEQDMRRIGSNLRLIESAWETNRDAVLVAYLISEMGGRTFDGRSDAGAALVKEITDDRSIAVPELRDLELEQLGVEQSLVPLLVKQQELVSDLGANHPAVKTLDAQVAMTRKALNELSAKRQRRVEELKNIRRDERLAQGEAAAADQENANSQQAQYISSFFTAQKGRLQLLGEQLGELETAIEQERNAAGTLMQAEKDEEMFRRQIARVQGMLRQLEEQMARLDISSVNSGVQVQPLMGSVSARVTGPDTTQDLMLFGMAGLALGALLSYLVDASARMFRSSEQIEAALGAPVITHIPLDEGRRPKRGKAAVESDAISKLDPKLAVVHRPLSAAAEAISCIRTAIFFNASKTGNKVFQITSPLPGDGKSTLAANIACSIAFTGKKVLLIDLDLRSPRLSARFGLAGKEGMTTLLNGECEPYSAIHQTPIENLEILPSGPIPANPAEALSLPEMRDAFEWFRDQYDFIIVDTPPLLVVTDPSIVTSYVDTTLLAMRIIRACKPNSKEAMSILRNAGANVMGILINKVDEVSIGNYYQVGGNGSYRSIGYGYGEKYRSERLKAELKESYVVRGGGVSRFLKAPSEGIDGQSSTELITTGMNGSSAEPH